MAVISARHGCHILDVVFHALVMTEIIVHGTVDVENVITVGTDADLIGHIVECARENMHIQPSV